MIVNVISLVFFLALCVTLTAGPAAAGDSPSPALTEGLHAFTAEDIDGKRVELSQYDGKVVLVVNVASRCGFTRQYEGLQSLYAELKDEGLVVLGFPANDFAGQEPGSNEEIKFFCRGTYNVTFPMFGKISVKPGDGQHPLFRYLTREAGEVTWNFNKFLVGKDGLVLRRFDSGVEPNSDELREAIRAALKG